MKKYILSFGLILSWIVLSFSLSKAFAFDSASKDNTKSPSQLVLFYSAGCPHCKDVEDLIDKHQLKTRFEITFKELSIKANHNLLVKTINNCNIKKDVIDLPVLWTGKNCLIGEDEVTNFLNQKMEQ
jgi:hypothetical protein